MSPILASLALLVAPQQPITVSFIHTNDLHARVLPVRVGGKSYGGYARVASLINRLRKESPNPIVLNAGDTFQGTLFFNVYEGLADVAIMNATGYQAMAVGNHEFDRGPGPLGEFAVHAQFPLLAANLDVSAEPTLKGRIHRYTVIEVGGQKVAVVGAITPDTPRIASPGPTVRFLDLRSSVQTAIDEVTKQGIRKVVLLTHIGYQEDRELARQLRGVDLIIGGHSHTPLGTPDLPGWRSPVGPYPTVEKDASGRDVYIVQAWQWGKVVGKIQLQFDQAGIVVGVPSARAIPVDETITEDPLVRSIVAAFEKPIAEMANRVVGESPREISNQMAADGTRPMANAIADAYLDATSKAGAVVAFINSGGIRSSIDAGPITFGEAVAVQPFNNTLVLLELTGQELLQALDRPGGGVLLPSRGSSYTLERSKPVGQRLSQVRIAGKDLDPTARYKIVIPSFIANGGDGHDVIKNAAGSRLDTGLLDIDAFVEYLKKNRPFDPPTEIRARFLGS